MLTLIDRLVKLFKKDFEFLSNYERSHPHFFWYLGIDAFLSAAIVFGGFTLYTQATSDPHRLTHVGAAVLTSEALIKHVLDEDVDAYWLGSSPTYEYSMDDEELDIVDIFYWQKGSFSDENQQFLYEVKTYKNQKAWDTRVHTILATTNTETIVVSPEITIRINPTSMKGVIVTFTSRKEIVALAYPASQKLQDMVKNVESLRPVR
ncbi:MAG: hypothetical protein Q8L08_10635 [Candidatus Nanopelagicaceae bacterium]|nr:hypothetical protein [Candidatus Nanopelagicaceae bacterium]